MLIRLALLSLVLGGCSPQPIAPDPSKASPAVAGPAAQATPRTVASTTLSEPPGRVDPAAGEAVWDAYCLACHGPEGKGDGPAAAALNPPPTDLSRAPTGRGADGKPPRSRYRVIMQGSPGTAMIGYENVLSREQIQALIGHLHLLLDPRDAGFHRHDGDTPDDEGHQASGEQLWNVMCANCHGISGKGDGPAAAALDPAPADLTVRRGPPGPDEPRPRRTRWEIVLEGSPGTAMVGWEDVLSAPELDAIHDHMRKLMGHDEGPHGPGTGRGGPRRGRRGGRP